MIEALLLVDGQDVSEDTLTRSTRVHTTKVLGQWSNSYVVSVWALIPSDPDEHGQSLNEHLENALREIAQVAGITRVVTLALKL